MLLIVFHHILFDGWSAEVLTRELNDAYDAVGAGKRPDWRPLRLDYLSYVAWDANRAIPAAQQQIATLRPLPERLALPLDFTRPATQSFDGKIVTLDLGTARGQALKRWAAEAGTTPFTLLLALIKAFLFRHTGQSDLIVGCPSANREIAETQDLIGLFANTLVVRTRFDPDQDFNHLLTTCHRGVQTALAAQEYPFERLIEDIGAPRDAARNPLFDVFVALEDASWGVWDRAPLRIKPITLPHHSAKFDLSFYFREQTEGGYLVDIEYATALFRETSIRAMSERLATLVDDALRRDHTPIARLALLPAHEQALLASFNATHEAFDLEGDADRRFRRQCRRNPDATALIEADGTRWSYAQFDRMVERLAAQLQGFGIGHGDPVGVCFPRSRDMLVAIFAVLRRGAVYVPLAEDLPEARLRAMLDDLGQAPVVCADSDKARLETLGLAAITPQHDADDAGTADPSEAVGDSLAYVIFTSGSTGRPKGVAIEHQSLANRLLWMQSRFPIGIGDVVLQKTTVSFDVSVWELLWWSWSGAAVALLEPGAEKDPARIVQAVERHGVTVLHFVPSMLRAFLDHLEAHAGAVDRLRSLKIVFTSGEALPRELVARFNALLGADLHNLYGPTEATIDVSWQPCQNTPAENEAVAIGRPVANTRLYLLDRLGQPVPVGVSGEIHIAGVQVARGYINGENPESFVLMNGMRAYRSGDQGFTQNGLVYYRGRDDQQVKIRGNRVEIAEVEKAVAAFPGVRQVTVVAGQFRTGEDKSLAAYVVSDIGIHALAIYLAQHLPSYCVPDYFVPMVELPLSANRKVDKKALPSPLGGRATAASGGRPPKSALEQALAALWTRLLGIAVTDATASFFTLGGHSILAIRLVALIEKDMGVHLSLPDLFQNPSIADLAEVLQGKTVKRDGPVIKLCHHEGGRSIFLFHPVGGSVFCYSDLARQLENHCSVYAVESAGFSTERNAVSTEYHRVETLADYYMKEILKVASGDVIFAGWSFGGLLAYETELRYQALGHTPNPVLILDTAADNRHARQIAAKDDVDLLKTLLKDAIAFDENVLRALPREDRLDYLVRLPTGFNAVQMDNLVQTYRRNTVAAARYDKRKRSSNKILFVRATDFANNPNMVVDDLWQGWDRIVDPANICLKWTEGTHETMLSPGLVGQVADCILDYLRQEGLL